LRLTITINSNEDLALHVVRFEGAVSFAELLQLGHLHKERPDFASADAVHIVDENADLSALTPEHLDILRKHYSELHRAIEFHVVRRAAWICRSPAAWTLAEYWVADRHSRDGQGTELCLVADLAAARILFADDELAAVKRWRGFKELARIESTASGSPG
jgi:hypothetical protein